MAEQNRDTEYTRIDRGEHDAYRKTRVYSDGTVLPGTLRFGVWRAPAFTVTDQTQRHTVTSKDVGQMDLIAYTYYGDESLWWVIAWANRIKNPITDMFVGQQLVIPDQASIATAIDGVV